MKRLFFVFAAFAAVLAGGATRIVQDQCGPFTDVSPAFCPFVLETYYLGITAGTSPTTFSPDNPMTRGQAAVFVSKAIDQTLARSSRRAALGQWWRALGFPALPQTAVGNQPRRLAADGADLWVVNNGDATVSRVRASDGRLLETWSGIPGGVEPLVALGRILVIGEPVASQVGLYMIDPSQTPGDATLVATSDASAGSPRGIAFDGGRIWTANGASISSFIPSQTPPWSETTISTGISLAVDVLYDGSSMWVSDANQGLLRLDASGAVIQTVPLGAQARSPVFDGANIWVPTVQPASVVVVRASTGNIVATLSGHALSSPSQAAFDGERILVIDPGSLTLPQWKAADLSSLGFLAFFAPPPGGVCSDGTRFWITFDGSPGHVASF